MGLRQMRPFRSLATHLRNIGLQVFVTTSQRRTREWDWFCPNRNAYILISQETRQMFEAEATRSGKDRLLLISAVPTSKYAIDSGYDVVKLSK